MKFLELQNMIVQTRKARKGVKNREDYFSGDSDDEKFWNSVYKKALSIANAVVAHYEEKGTYDSKDKVRLALGEEKVNDYFQDYIKQTMAYEEVEKANRKLWKEHKALLNEKLELDGEVGRLKRELTKVQEDLARAKRGGRYKDYAKENQVVKYKQENPASTVREIAKALGISTTTVQKALVANGLNKQRG